MINYPKKNLHNNFFNALGKSNIISHSDLSIRPINIVTKLGNNLSDIRLYLFPLTNPPGGRVKGEFKIQLTISGQKHGEKKSLDFSGEKTVLLAGFNEEHNIFALWDSAIWTNFVFARNLMITPDKIFKAKSNLEGINIIKSERKVPKTTEEIIIFRPEKIFKALELRSKLNLKRILN